MFKSCLQNVQISAAKVMIYCKIEHKTNKKIVLVSVQIKRKSFLPSSTTCAYGGVHRIDVHVGALAARVGHVARVVAVPVGAAADGAAVFHGVRLSRLQLRVGEEHHHIVAPTAATAASEGRTLVGANHGAVRFQDLDGVAGLRVDFQRGLGTNVLRRVARRAARADVGAARDFELVVVAVEAFFGLSCPVGDGEAAVEEQGAV